MRWQSSGITSWVPMNAKLRPFMAFFLGEVQVCWNWTSPRCWLNPKWCSESSNGPEYFIQFFSYSSYSRTF
jgi:hypothetical protein